MRKQILRRWGWSGVASWLMSASACTGGDASGAEDGACATDCPAPTSGDATSGNEGDSTGASITEGSDADDGSDTAGPSGEGIPCDVRDVLAANCWTCHGEMPKFGAPMSLASAGDFQMPAQTDGARPVHELVAERIGSETAPMPADGTLSTADQAALQAWVGAAAPVSSDACDGTDPPPVDPVGPDALPCEVTQTFTAHSDGTDPFAVPLVDNLYQCFTFASPLAAETHITAWAPIVDDERVLHHWILYGTPTPQPDGGVGPCQMPSDAAFIAGWAPGGGNFEMPDGVGLEFGGPSDYYILQVHYNNTAGYDDAMDNSGVALCTSPPKSETAGIVWLGTTDINIPGNVEGYETSGTCPSSVTAGLPADLNVIASFPHMHELGRALTTEIYRGGPAGPMEVLIDADPFMFSNQVMYPHDPPIVINPGDELITRCRYDNASGVQVGFGEDTEEEMCYNFIMAYPIQDIPSQSRQCVP